MPADSRTLLKKVRAVVFHRCRALCRIGAGINSRPSRRRILYLRVHKEAILLVSRCLLLFTGRTAAAASVCLERKIELFTDRHDGQLLMPDYLHGCEGMRSVSERTRFLGETVRRLRQGDAQMRMFLSCLKNKPRSYTQIVPTYLYCTVIWSPRFEDELTQTRRKMYPNTNTKNRVETPKGRQTTDKEKTASVRQGFHLDCCCVAWSPFPSIRSV